MNNPLQDVRNRHARMFEFRRGVKPESDWIIQAHHARTALERLCSITHDSPQIRKPVRSALSNLNRAAALKESR